MKHIERDLDLAMVILEEIKRLLNIEEPRRAYNLICTTQQVLDKAAVNIYRSIGGKVKT